MCLRRGINHRLSLLERKLSRIMSDQDTLNAFVARIGDAVTSIKAEIDGLKNQPGSAGLDFTALDTAVASVEGLEPAPAAPAVGATGATGSDVPPPAA